MIEVVITDRNSGSVRNVALDMGQHIFGSSLNCDVVLLDHGVMAYHFTLDVREDQVLLDMLPARYSDDPNAELEYEQDASLSLAPWAPDATLQVGALDITIPDAPRVPTTDDLGQSQPAKMNVPTIHSPKHYWRNLPTPLRVTVLSGLAVIFMVGVIPEADIGSQDNGIVKSFGTANATASFMSPRDFLGVNGESVYQQRLTNNSWVVDIHTSDNAQQKEILGLLEGYGQPVDVRFHQKEAIVEGASAIVAAVAPDVAVTGFKDGILTLDGLVDGSSEANDLADIIQNDLRAIRSVQFTNLEVSNDEAIKAAIKGVWFGDQPYLIVEEDVIVRSGQTIVDGVTLREVFSNSILISVGQEERLVRLDG